MSFFLQGMVLLVVSANTPGNPDTAHPDGIPFTPASWTGDEGEGRTRSLAWPAVPVRRLFLRGATNSDVRPHPAWGGGDSFQNFFIGDEAGVLVLEYASGREDRVPLLFGHTVWWRNHFAISPAPFREEGDARDLLARALCVANGLDGWKADAPPYFICIEPRDEPLAGIRIEDNPAKIGHIVFDGYAIDPDPSNPGLVAWLDTHTVRVDDPVPAERREALDELRGLLHTQTSDLTRETVAKTAQAANLRDWPGPRLVFHGPVEADILTHVYRDNSAEILTRIDDDGMIRESAEGADNFRGFGGWTPGLGAFHGDAYTRNRTVPILAGAGLDDPAHRVLDFFNRWLMYFPESFPELQLDGKPVPGHMPVIANKPHVYFDTLRHHGWPTKYTVRDFGNPETDGHGFLMLSHWVAWVRAGQPESWVRERWEPIREAADFIGWAIDNPELSFSEHGLLYAESEGGMSKVTFYCNVPCWLGLLGHARMATVIGETEAAAHWQSRADAILDAMNAYFPGNVDPWGDVWDPAKTAHWANYHTGSLAPLYMGMEHWGYDVLPNLPEGWLERTRRSYDMSLERMQPAWCAPAGIGYGQCYHAQSALIMDRMEDARQTVEWMAKLSFAPRLPHPFRVPEGSIVASDGSVWRRWGDLGNLYQMNDVVRTIQVMTGADDLAADGPKLMPRVPADWEGFTLTGQPLRVTSGGTSAQAMLDIDLRRDNAAHTQSMTLKADRPVDRLRVRMGPFPKDARVTSATFEGNPVEAKTYASGDSQWCWIPLSDVSLTGGSLLVSWE
jgi:hypothetical protein